MVFVIELLEHRPPVGTVGREGMQPTRFDGWLGLIATLSRLLEVEDERLAAQLARRLDGGGGLEDEQIARDADASAQS
jgi:hypothetical protein